MCGIVGVWRYDGLPVELHQVEALTARLHHRGPDAAGLWCEEAVGLGHRRLSIIDLQGSAQPMSDEVGECTIVFNGEIYNFKGLREELESHGCRFRTMGDTEVLLAAYRQWGGACVQRLRGMFAFAIWDARRGECFFARDRFGIKPLCFYQGKGFLAFASEVQAFAALGETFDRQIAPEALDKYLYYGYIPAPGSLFRNVFKLPPGHVCRVKDPGGALVFERYWEARFEPDERLSEEEWVEGLEAKLRESVRCHLVSDVPVGAFLSGGIDSSVVVATMASLSSDPVLAYTVGFKEEAFDERSVTRLSSDKLNVHYREEELELEILKTLDVLVAHYGEPFADSSAVCTYHVTGVAAREVKVMLSGDGGDEVFGGYSHYGWMLREF